MSFELAEVRLDWALVFVHARSVEVVLHGAVVAFERQVTSTGVPLGRHSSLGRDDYVNYGVVLEGVAQQWRSAAAASGLGGILPVREVRFLQGSWLSAFVVDSSHRIANGSCIGVPCRSVDKVLPHSGGHFSACRRPARVKAGHHVAMSLCRYVASP